MQFNRIELHVKEAEFSYQLRHVFEVHTLTHASIQAANKSVSVRERIIRGGDCPITILQNTKIKNVQTTFIMLNYTSQKQFNLC